MVDNSHLKLVWWHPRSDFLIPIVSRETVRHDVEDRRRKCCADIFLQEVGLILVSFAYMVNSGLNHAFI